MPPPRIVLLPNSVSVPAPFLTSGVFVGVASGAAMMASTLAVAEPGPSVNKDDDVVPIVYPAVSNWIPWALSADEPKLTFPPAAPPNTAMSPFALLHARRVPSASQLLADVFHVPPPPCRPSAALGSHHTRVPARVVVVDNARPAATATNSRLPLRPDFDATHASFKRQD